MTEIHQATTVIVLYNGTDKTIEYAPHETVRALLDKAIAAFGIGQNQHLMALYDPAGQELGDNSSLEAAGVKPGEELVLRQSVVRGG